MKRFNVESEVSADGIRAWLKESGCNIAVNKNAVVYRGKKYIMLYAPNDGEYDFCDKGKRSFTDLFSQEKIEFPTQLKRAQCLLFERS